MTGWRVRPATPADRAAVAALVEAAYRPLVLDPPTAALTEAPAVLAAELADPALPALVAQTGDGRLIGALRQRQVGPLRWWRRVCVHPDWQRRGVASALAAAALADVERAGTASAVRVGVRRALPGNRALWEGLGFRELADHGYWVELGRPVWRALPGAAATRALGAAVAGVAVAGDLLILRGELGAGKTTFVQGLGRGLGVAEAVTSPTFVLAREHPPAQAGRPGLLHVDAYRLGSLAELDDLDLDTPLAAAVTAVEWGGDAAAALSARALLVELDRDVDPAGGGDAGRPAADGDEVRRARLTVLRPGGAAGARWQDAVDGCTAAGPSRQDV